MQVQLKADGLYWPDSDQDACYDWTHTEIAHVPEIVAACDHHDVMIHAGANVGAYALKFSEAFDQVYAFEPDRHNFKCLCVNTIDSPNIWPQMAALGAHTGTVHMHNTHVNNCGTVSVQPDHVKGWVPMITIDSLNLQHVSCVHLDLEGYELFALEGAQHTISRCKPVVVVEWLDHGIKYGHTQSHVQNFLYNLGYTRMKAMGSDMMFKT